ncbi:MAG: RagB/SusD family nutrient uptake outer membrane protein [Rhizobacter sp.]|nr:RagB/SusD family nutrient uptake outer membrane protein [Ferruginibacter sp.]
MKQLINRVMSFLLLAAFASCTKDLDQQPSNSNNADVQYSTPEGYKQGLAKAYGSYSVVSSRGVGISDVNVPGVSDAGTTDFVRSWFNLQELTTDEGICAWDDGNLQAFHNFNWTANNIFVNTSYARGLFQITVCNEFIRQSTNEKVASRGISGHEADEIRFYRAEARFLRAFQYWVLMDLFGNPPFVTDEHPVGKYFPEQISRTELFDYIESELIAIEPLLKDARTNEYGRADKGAAWALLARLYLNAEVYTGIARYTDAITYASKVINGGYTLMPNYSHLFMSDNNVNNTETILAIGYDAVNSPNYGGTTFLICSAHGTNPADNAASGIPGGGWRGNRATKNLPEVFGDYSGNSDKRAKFGQGSLLVNNVLTFEEGTGVTKFSNVKAADGTIPYSPNGVLVNTDFPLFRLAEMHLVYIESVKRGGSGGTDGTALQYFNTLRQRAYGNTNGNVAAYTLEDVLNERQRELYWECHRRTDLIRFNYFTSSTYLWPWKGGVAAGTGADNKYKVFPIPATEIIANSKLTQNTGY